MNAMAPTYLLDSFFCLRTPLLPLAIFRTWNDGLVAAEGSLSEAAITAGLIKDRAVLRARLETLLERSDLLEALYVASPDLVDSLPRWRKDPDGEKGQRTEMALVRYIARMCHRSTPFGLFAGLSTGRMSATSKLELGSRADYRRRSRMDMGLLCGIVEAAHLEPDLRERLVGRALPTGGKGPRTFRSGRPAQQSLAGGSL
jgi:hypothetical protein